MTLLSGNALCRHHVRVSDYGHVHSVDLTWLPTLFTGPEIITK
jgi:hypothetical protein